MKWMAVMGLVAFLMAGAFADTVRISTPAGVVSIETSRQQVNLGDVIRNIQARVDSIMRIASNDPSCAGELRPLLLELSVLVQIFPPDLYSYTPQIEIAEPMDDETFAAYLESIKEEIFSDDKLDYLRQTSRKNYFTCEQLGQILDLFDFSDDKLEAVRILKPRIVDPENAFMLKNKFTFDSDRKKFLDIMYSD